MPQSAIDFALTAQIVVAWAGEAGEERRLAWWRTDLVSEFGGHDLFKRLLPHTWEWAALQAAREAARRTDADLRARDHDPDRLVSLYHLGFEIDERLDERFAELKKNGVAPNVALPVLDALIAENWSRGAFTAWVGSHGGSEYTVAPAGRSLGAPSPSLEENVRRIVAALAPIADAYPLPHFKRPA